ncbi:MAG: FliA/WhiG family RNA polymerase sigma factor [Syntrophomonadaceae bacterium]|jgi:RNA polymerase sigma factor for flagellar operon FliA|nr:FliA/WhiG family RNA polymerase sigma factor [Syntrophomonadaceae bacterium]
MKPDLMQLWQRFKEEDDQNAREELVIHYSYLVKYMANRMAINLPPSVEVDELISYGIEGLIEAADKFDYQRKIKFETYAIARIKGAMIDGLRAMDWVPVSVRQKSKELEKAYNRIEIKLGRNATDQEVAEELGITLAQFQALLRDVGLATILYLEDFLPGEDGNNRRIIDFIEDEQADNALNIAEFMDTKRLLSEAISRLPEKEKLVLELYYYEGLNLKEIGAVMGLSESRISQLHSKAILRLRGRLSRRKSQLI